ncbi:MAG: hypothetical protein ABI721_05860 [Candidatus Dojkabacteria bacterium]
METRITGIDQIRKLVESDNKVTRFTIRRNVDELLSNEFMQRYTRFWSFTEMQSAFKLKYGVELTSNLLHSEIFDKFIEDNSKFKVWRELLSKASEIHMSKLVRKAMFI